MFRRKPSALAPLDGMRFMAVLWVILIHNTAPSPAATFEFYQCRYMLENFIDYWFWLWTLSCNGDMGVDIFFVLSGFLIMYMLSKEYNKYGDIDWSHFMKMRFLRLYPAYVSFLIVCNTLICGAVGIVAELTWSLPAFLFVANISITSGVSITNPACRSTLYGPKSQRSSKMYQLQPKSG